MWATLAWLGCAATVRESSQVVHDAGGLATPPPVPESSTPREPAEEKPAETPQPVAVRINAAYGDADRVDEWTKNFESGTREAFVHKAKIVTAVGLTPGNIVADVGAGTGLFTVEFARSVGPKGRVFAVDPQEAFLAHIRARAISDGLTNVQTVQASQRASGLAPDSVDVVFMCDAYHHLELPRTYLADLHRALRAGGRLVVVDYDGTRVRSRFRQEHVRADPAEFRAEIEAAGFELVAEPDLLRENFVMIFVRRQTAPVGQ